MVTERGPATRRHLGTGLRSADAHPGNRPEQHYWPDSKPASAGSSLARAARQPGWRKVLGRPSQEHDSETSKVILTLSSQTCKYLLDKQMPGFSPFFQNTCFLHCSPSGRDKVHTSSTPCTVLTFTGFWQQNEPRKPGPCEGMGSLVPPWQEL